MEDPEYLSLLLIFVLLAFSAYFSGSETAFFSINKFKINQLKEKKKDSFLIYILERPRQLLVTIIIGNIFVNIFATVTATEFFIAKYGVVKGNAVSTVVMTLLLLFFGEITPKILAVNTANKFSKISAPIMRVFMCIFSPISLIILKVVNFILKIMGFTEYTTDKHISQEELKTIIDLGDEDGIIQNEEKEMLRSVFEFSDTSIDEIMTPRIDMVCIEKSATIEEIRNIIREEHYSRIPVYEESRDNIVGIIYVKDIIKYLTGIKNDFDINEVMRDPKFVPETKDAYSLLRFMQKNKIHMVMVADEYGGTEGLVTMEDIIEEVVGEIHDEHDEVDNEFEFISKNVIEADAKMHIDDINEVFNLNIEENPDYNTISGYIMHKLGRVPNQFDSIEDEDFTVQVLKMDGNRIEKVKLTREKGKEE